MRVVTVTPPSFPSVERDCPLLPQAGREWQVLCGDADHWRAGVFSPQPARAEEIGELERHTCPELFLLMHGRVTLVLADGAEGRRELPLELGRPVLVTSAHAGYCPDGAHTGAALVIERDRFSTEYRAPEAW
ncbi:MAG: hypothetical protein HYV63_20155 [Candidatus Schekmanbacteria bacterium]|nr:hypothetical protein [Candidatus Schekmanbacteria bacterium]